MTSREALGVPSPSYLQTPTSKLAYQSFGKGPPILCLHAIAHGGGDFVPLAPRLGDRARVIALDFPGHGHSPEDGIPPTGAHYARIAGDALRALGIEHAFVLGNSIGGLAALLLAAQHPVRGLVLCNAAGLAPVGPFERWAMAAMARFFGAGERGAAWFPLAYALYYRLVLPRAPARRRAIVQAGPELAGLLRTAWEGFVRNDQRELALRLDVPVLAAWAAQDRIIALPPSLPTLQRMRHTELRRFRGGHAAFLEDPDRFADALLGFVQAQAGAPRAMSLPPLPLLNT